MKKGTYSDSLLSPCSVRLIEIPRGGRVKTYTSSMFGLKQPFPPVCPVLVDTVYLGSRDGGVGQCTASAEQGLTCPFPHTFAPQSVLRPQKCFSHIQVSFLSCGLLQSVHFVNERHVIPLPTGRLKCRHLIHKYTN